MSPYSPESSSLSVTSLSQYVRYHSCDRYLRFRLHPEEEKAMEQRWSITLQPLTPLLKEEGESFETSVEQAITARGERVEKLNREANTATTLAWLQRAQEPIVLLQVPVAGRLGRWHFHGVADVVRAHRQVDGTLHLYVADIKASRRERTEHRIQVATYALLLREMAESAGLRVGEIHVGVLHRNDAEGLAAFGETSTFDMTSYATTIEHLVSDADSSLERVDRATFDEIAYHLNYECDGCLYNALCFYDSAERLDLSLVPYLTATEKRVLQENGVRDLIGLANLLVLPESGQEFAVTPGAESTVERLGNTWPVNARLPLIVQRAKRALKRFVPGTPSQTYLYGAGFGTLPADDEHPGLVKIFFDAQHDYLRDHVYLLAALVCGPRGSVPVIGMLNAPPTLETEQRLLTGWVQKVLSAVATVTDQSAAPIHFYCYNSYDQRMLLEALKRHLDAVSLLPGFFDLMTQNPAVNQPIISFLAKEVEERRNLGTICAPLHDVARMLGFDWNQDGVPYYRHFRARLFDNRRDVVRDADGRLHNAPDTLPPNDPQRITIESASRFNSQIPLEYAYAVWGELANSTDRRIVQPFLGTTRELMTQFADARVRALAHIEASFKNKARFLNKPCLDLAGLRSGTSPAPSLAQSLREFLYMEHHASLQAKLQTYALPIDRRMRTGLALLLRGAGPGESPGTTRFEIPFDLLKLDPVLTMNGLRLKEGDWVVLNAADEARSANQIKHGRLATLDAIGPDWVDLRLLSMSFKASTFRYGHHASLDPEVGRLYTLDEMADDLNADKMLDGLKHTDGNVLYQWLLKSPCRQPQPPALAADTFLGLVNTLEKPHRLTEVQRSVLVKHLATPLLLVQGPPGTGKSHTMGWAVLYRLLNAAAAHRPFRVAVTCKTHNATNIVLESVAKKLRKLAGFQLPALASAIRQLRVYKLINDGTDPVPDGVIGLNAYTAGKSELERILDAPYLVIGGTPGGLYNLARYRRQGGNEVDWSAQPFDLLIVDEASQMSVPEGVLAGAFLRPSGQVIVVGDHRQMPPIVAHDWKREEKRSIRQNQPYLSLFEFLLDRGFPRESLDQSFRLHATLARFLQENIYVHDGIRFYSNRQELLTPAPPVNPFVDRVMDPDFPIVVVEHNEHASQQFNTTELSLVATLMEAVIGMRLDGMDGVGIVVPHRAQKAMLCQLFPYLAKVNAIDTVERFQGSERDVIIVSATASDPDFVLAEADFLLNLNRFNVALSRPRKKLIVVASRAVTQLLVSELDVFEHAILWKRLYHQYARQMLWNGQISGVEVTARGCPAVSGSNGYHQMQPN